MRDVAACGESAAAAAGDCWPGLLLALGALPTPRGNGEPRWGDGVAPVAELAEPRGRGGTDDHLFGVASCSRRSRMGGRSISAASGGIGGRGGSGTTPKRFWPKELSSADTATGPLLVI